VAERADEALISDKLAGRLGIVALDFGEGLWCFRDELGMVDLSGRGPHPPAPRGEGRGVVIYTLDVKILKKRARPKSVSCLGPQSSPPSQT